MNCLRSKKRSGICILIIIFVLITGMCFDGVKTHSTFLYSSDMGTNVILSTISALINGQPTCTREMLQIKNASEILADISWNDKQSREIAMFDNHLVDFLLKEPGGILLFIGLTLLLYDEAGERITNFVHRSDGKKRLRIVKS